MKLTILGGKDTLVGETLRASSEVNEKLPGKLFLRDLYGSLRIISTFGLLETIPPSSARFIRVIELLCRSLGHLV